MSARLLLAIALLTLAWLGTSCNTFSARQAEAEYGPSEGILETVAVLRRHVPDDTYRFPPASDFSGRNVYRASLLRLENLERAEAEALRSGYMDAVIGFAKARALERLRAFDLAADYYRESARISGELRATALESAEICDRIDQAIQVGLDLVDPLAEGGVLPLPVDADTVRLEIDDRTTHLTILLEEVRGSHYQWIVQEEIERADEARAGYFVSMRAALSDGTLLALQELQRVATRHGASKNRLRHLLRLADFYAGLAREYVDAMPPESLGFDPAKFRELVDAAIRLYELVASHDGRPEKLEATRSLEAFLALTLGIDADRFDR
ncbi:MAG: hypothetical protein CL908_20780 [Deltaproteobacteria bacterium]|nr:hypothetical protein [Deltaproteobacteria bacterium]